MISNMEDGGVQNCLEIDLTRYTRKVGPFVSRKIFRHLYYLLGKILVVVGNDYGSTSKCDKAVKLNWVLYNDTHFS